MTWKLFFTRYFPWIAIGFATGLLLRAIGY